jgi:dihydroorotate dehydrogenase electron transfer subunit
MVLGCGPEVMNRFLLKACSRTTSRQLSLERLMKCGSGCAGHASFDGLRVCADGRCSQGADLAHDRVWKKQEGRRRLR